MAFRCKASAAIAQVRFAWDGFWGNEMVTLEKVIENARNSTSDRVDGLHILAIQDTTSLRDDGLGNSLFGHATIAV